MAALVVLAIAVFWIGLGAFVAYRLSSANRKDT